MFVHGKIEDSTVNGPGHRAVIWLQGCRGMNCLGCWNQETHEHGVGNQETVTNLLKWIAARPDIEGVTFSGGEPMQQAADLMILAQLIRARCPDLSIGMYTGYTLKELEEGRFVWFDCDAAEESSHDEFIPGNSTLWRRIRENLDFAIMGRYNALLRTSTKPLCGSSNQELVLLSTFYKQEDFEPQEVEIVISPNAGLVSITGFPLAPDAFVELCR